jgi:hypothetical protein
MGTVTTDIGAANQIGIKKEVLGTRALEKRTEKRLVLMSTLGFCFEKRKVGNWMQQGTYEHLAGMLEEKSVFLCFREY